MTLVALSRRAGRSIVGKTIEVSGVLGYLIALPILLLTFLWLALTFLFVVLCLAAPLIMIGLIVWLIAT